MDYGVVMWFDKEPFEVPSPERILTSPQTVSSFILSPSVDSFLLLIGESFKTIPQGPPLILTTQIDESEFYKLDNGFYRKKKGGEQK